MKKCKIPIATLPRNGESANELVHRIITTTLKNIEQDIKNYTFDKHSCQVSISFDISPNKVMTYDLTITKYVTDDSGDCYE